MVEQDTTIATPDGAMSAFVARPDGSRSPVVVVYMDGLGYREDLRDVARRLAEEGYYALLPDLFYRSGDGVVFDLEQVMQGPENEEFQRMLATIGELGDDMVLADTRALLEHVRGDPAAAADAPKGCIGFCMGGRLVLRAMAALPEDFAAGAALHPSFVVTPEPDSPHLGLATVAGELYLGFAENDTITPPEVIPQVREQLERHGIRHAIDLHRGASHGYMLPGPPFDAEAAELAWRRTLELFGRNLQGAPVAA